MRKLVLAVIGVIAIAAPAMALNPGTDVLVPAAGRVNEFVTDMYVANPGAATTSVVVYWLERGADNSDLATSFTFDLLPGETQVLTDVIFADFGLTEGAGAFRVTADTSVIVNSRIYAVVGDTTLGQGFAGVPASLATQVGATTYVVGLSQNATFRTNVYALADADGATMTLALLNPSGVELASRTLTLRAYEPYLKRVDQVFSGLANFDDGTLTVTVTAGAAVVGASKVDNASTDPTTLESAVATATAAPATVNGTYQFALYDSSSFAAGGNIVVSDGEVEAINGTYVNWDKLDGNVPACTLIFQWGFSLPITALGDFASGVSFTDDYTASGSGKMRYTVTFTPNDDNLGLTGIVSAVGSDFPSDPDPNFDQSGCNGLFDPLTFMAGKSSN